MVDPTPRRSLGLRTISIPIIMIWLAASAGASLLRAQCVADWRPGEGHPGVTGDLPVLASIPWDPDGAGPRPQILIVAGGFEGAGNVPAFGIASWSGDKWSSLASTGANGPVRALAVYGGDLIAAGDFLTVGGMPATRIARWDGASWHSLGSGLNNSVRAIAVYNGELYAGGFFTQAGGATARGIARWNGSSWQSLGAGINTVVTALGVSGGKLIVGGSFTAGIPATRIAAWSGSTWASLDGPSGERIENIEAFSEYNAELIAAATFISSTGSYLRRIGRWDGTAWRSMGVGASGAGPDDAVMAVTPYHGELYVGGIFAHAGGVSTPGRMARWNGSAWLSVPLGLGMPGRQALSLTVFGDYLIAGGLTTRVDGEQTSEIGRFDGNKWNYMSGGMNEVVTAVASYHGDLYLGGYFSQAGDITVSAIARRSNDGRWNALQGGLSGDCCGGSVNPVDSMVVYQDSLVISGSFTTVGGHPASGVARWDGASWTAFGSARVTNLLEHQGSLYGTMGAGLPSTVVKWDPATQQWTSLGAPHARAMILALGVFNGELIAGGFGFDIAPASVYRWDGATWHPMGSTFDLNWIEDLIAYNGELIATGRGVPGLVMRWTGSSWQMLGGGLNGTVVWDMHVYNGALIVGGEFSLAGGLDHIARWDGSSWSPMGTGPNDDVQALGVHNGDLVAGGWFTMAGGRPNGHWARFGVVCASSPSAAADSLEGLPPMIVSGYDRSTDVVTISYGPACGATDHVVHAGPLDRVSSYGYDMSRCQLGTSGLAQVNVGPGSRFWVIAGHNDGVEGSAGRDSAGHERPYAATGGCEKPQQFGGTCAGAMSAAP